MNPTDFIRHVKKLPFYQGQIAHVHRLPARKARYARLRRPLPRPLASALEQAGAEKLYTHQARAINAVRSEQHVVVSTSTASGKTLCYNVPVLEAALGDWRARALYLFPTKALAQDQLRALRELTRGELSRIRFGAYDGDTPRAARARLRKEAAIILTNPDMLHLGILPNHTLWSNFFRHLRFVVVDEAHVYRGVFGSQVACVLRRLHRVCAFYGRAPQFVCCSATIANPGEHVARLTGVEPVVVDDDGSPGGEKEFVLWNPPFVDRTRTARRSASREATRLFVELVKAGLRNITFVKARKVAELILLYARELLAKEAPELTGLIRSYRAGYLPEERREIEQALFRGKLLGVTATTALELGVDVGRLEATVQVGYPGTIASLWQQAGRAGRGTRRSLSILVGLDNPLDQYFMRHPRELFGRPHEHALIDPGNPYILERHLPCAAHEHPLSSDDEQLFGPNFPRVMARLEERRRLEYNPASDRWRSVGSRYPAQGVSLRSAGGTRVALLNGANGYRMMEEMEASAALRRVHPGAIYLHQGESFLVTDLNLDLGEAYLEPVDVNYYTQPREVNEVSIVRSLEHRAVGPAQAFVGRVRVTEQVIGYRRVQQFTETTLGVEYLDLPAQEFETVAVWWDVPPAIARQVARQRLDFHGGLHAVEHAAIGLLPLFALCDRLDIGGLSTPSHPDTGQAQIFIYDAFPGGVGIAEKGFELLPELWRATLEAVRECPCQGGCPSCIQSPRCGNNNEPLDKAAAVVVLRALLRR